jgi:hypothetical protein
MLISIVQEVAAVVRSTTLPILSQVENKKNIPTVLAQDCVVPRMLTSAQVCLCAFVYMHFFAEW